MRPAAAPPPPASRPALTPPPDACDAHAHMVSGPDDPRLWAERVEDPAPGGFEDWLDRYRAHLDALGLTRGVLVQSILYGDDNTVIAEALARLGSGFAGVAVVRDEVAETSLDALADAGFRALRLNYVHGGLLSWAGAARLAPALAERGMHLQMLARADQDLPGLADAIRACPTPVVLDHCAWPALDAGVEEPGFATLRALLAEGHVWVKLSAVFRLCAAPWTDADAGVASLVAANPDQCLWGSDWPYLMLGDAEAPDPGRLLDALGRAVPDEADQARILRDNPARLYGLG